MSDCSCHSPQPIDRRGFLKRAFAAGIGLVITLVPVAAGLAVWLDPLRRKGGGNQTIRVATLDAVPADGVPRKFPVLAARVDAWNKFADVPIGAVYLRRTADGQLHALNVACPHAGCFVDFLPARGAFLCPCHNSSFTADGRINDPASPSARSMDSLEVEVRNEKEVWVKFQNFQAGRPEKVPAA